MINFKTEKKQKKNKKKTNNFILSVKLWIRLTQFQKRNRFYYYQPPEQIYREKYKVIIPLYCNMPQAHFISWLVG